MILKLQSQKTMSRSKLMVYCISKLQTLSRHRMKSMILSERCHFWLRLVCALKLVYWNLIELSKNATILTLISKEHLTRQAKSGVWKYWDMKLKIFIHQIRSKEAWNCNQKLNESREAKFWILKVRDRAKSTWPKAISKSRFSRVKVKLWGSHKKLDL